MLCSSLYTVLVQIVLSCHFAKFWNKNPSHSAAECARKPADNRRARFPPPQISVDLENCLRGWRWRRSGGTAARSRAGSSRWCGQRFAFLLCAACTHPESSAADSVGLHMSTADRRQARSTRGRRRACEVLPGAGPGLSHTSRRLRVLELQDRIRRPRPVRRQWP